MKGAQICREAGSRLREAGFDNVNELNSLFYAATGKDRLSAFDLEIDPDTAETFIKLVQRRLNGEPLQYICGEWPFLDFTVHVDERALIPRPETELLAELAIKCMADSSPTRILDLCSGSGVLAISLKRAFPNADVTAVELSISACSLLTENAVLCNTALEIIQADAIEYLNACEAGCFDLIVCNPPYITPSDYSGNYDELRFEPKMAFIGGDDGMFFYKALTAPAFHALKSGGFLCYEIGNDQGEAVCATMAGSGFIDTSLHRDLAGLDRDVCGRKP